METQLQSQVNNRIDYIDIAKGVGIILVVLGHMSIGKTASYLIFSFHMPFFFLVDGLFCKNYEVFSDEHKRFIKKIFMRLILPYVATCVLMISFSVILNLLRQNFSEIIQDAKHWALATLYGQGAYNNKSFPIIGAIWFLWAMFWGRLIFSFFSGRKICFPIVIFLFAVGYVSSKYFYLPLSIQSGLTSIIFIWTGKEIKEHKLLEKNWFLLFVIALELWISMLFLKAGKMSIVRNYYDAIPANVISGVSGSLALILLSEKNENIRFFSILRYIGKYSLIFLCLHILDLNLFPWNCILKRIPINNQVFTLTFLFIMKMLMYFCGCFMILHTPLKYVYDCRKNKL